MFSAGAVSAVLSGNFNPAGFIAFDGAMNKAKRSMDDVEKRGGKLHKTMATIGKVGAGAAAVGIFAVGTALAKSVSLAADFEQELSRLKATSSATGKQMQMLRKDAMAAGAATKFSALDAAKAQTELAKGGLTVAQIHGGALKAALSLASAGELGLADAAATTVNAMKQFGLEGSKAGHVADALATAANSTTVDVSDLSLALRAGGGVAAMAGASFDETIAAISALADASVKGSDAGTSLKSFFLNIATPSPKASKAMRDLGMSIFTASGQLKPMVGIAENLRQAFGKLTQQQFLNKAGTIAGSDAARALFAIYKAGPDGIRRYLEAQKEAGTAAATAATKQDNLRGKIENLKGSLETAGIALGTGLLPGLTDGAEKATKAINDMAASGDLEKMGKNLGDIVTAMVEAGPAITKGLSAGVTGLGVAIKVVEGALLPVVGTFAGMLNVVTAMADTFNALSGVVGGPHIDTGGLAKARDDVGDLADKIRKDLLSLGKHDVKVKVSADTSAAVTALKTIGSVKLREKIVRILGKDIDAAAKIKQIVALGIPAKIARILTAGVPRTLADLAAVRAAVGGLPATKTVTLTTINRSIQTGSKITKTPPVKLGGKATGRGAGMDERALVGEGTGPELVAGPDGWAWITQPTVMDLGAGDYVIPTDPRYSGRALGLMFGMLGVPGYAKGKAAAKPKPLAIPDAVRFGAVPEDELDSTRDNAREAYQKRRDKIHGLDVDIRASRRKIPGLKGKARSHEQAHLSELQRERSRYNDGGSGLQSLAVMRKQWRDLEAQAKVLHATNQEIDRLNTLQETDRTRMATASRQGDRTAWTNARRGRADILQRLRAMYAKAVRLAKPGSGFAAELEGKLAGVEGDIADAAADTFTADLTPEQQAIADAVQRLTDTGMTDAEAQALTGLQAQQSLAALTAGTADDQAAAVATEQFLTGILASVQADPRRGGAASVRDIADQLAAARQNVASFTGGGTNTDPDLQAQLDQQRARADTAERTSQINAQALAVFQGSADIGYGRPNFVINTLHPGDPATLRAIGDAATGGIALQPSVLSPRQPTGL